MLTYSLLFVFHFVVGGSDCPGAALVYVPGEDGESSLVCGAHLFILSIDAHVGLELVISAERNSDKFSQYSMAWGGFPQPGVQDVTEFDFG
jgi:hypothetical protein